MAWQERAKCAEKPLEETYWLREPTAAGRWDSAQHRQAKAMCYGCPVINDCLNEALQFEKGLSSRSRHGIWGATVPDERARLSRRLTAVSA